MVDDYTKKWIIKALNDFKVMLNERKVPPKDLVTDAICFHAQQAVEKFLKAYLVAYNIEFGKTHNLKTLLGQCIEHDSDFTRVSVGDLSDYAVAVRYPDEFYEPTLEEVDKHITIATDVKKFVLDKLTIKENTIRKQ